MALGTVEQRIEQDVTLGDVIAAMDGWRTVFERTRVRTVDERTELLAVVTEMEAAAARVRGLVVDSEALAPVVHYAGFAGEVGGAGVREVCARLTAEGDEARIVGLPARVTCRVCAGRLAAMGRR